MLLIPVDAQDELQVTHVDDSSSHHPLWQKKDEEVKRLVYPHLLLVPLMAHDREEDISMINEGDNEEQATRFLQVQQTLLLRPTHERPGLVAYHLPSLTILSLPNRRATSLAMTCGLWKRRFYGNVLLDWIMAPGSSWLTKTSLDEIHQWSDELKIVVQNGPCHSPDHRLWTLSSSSSNDDQYHNQRHDVRDWLLTAAHENYHDAETLQRWTQLTVSNNRRRESDDSNSSIGQSESSSNTHNSSSSSSNNSDSSSNNNNSGSSPLVNNDPTSATSSPQEEPSTTEQHDSFVTMHEPLCLHCRRPTMNLCEQCHGAYFCPPPRQCRIEGWSHDCLCATWKVYVNRRELLSTFPFPDDWYKVLVTRACQISNAPYEDDFLTHTLGVPPLIEQKLPEEDTTSWWITERCGWSGGTSVSAQGINPQRRVSYATGFVPLASYHIPPETVVSCEAWKALAVTNSSDSHCIKNDAGLYQLCSWADYYSLRGLPHDSPAALLLTFPLTLYYALVEYGTVPWTVARMLNRPLRIDIVGAEKELHFVDLFQEVAFLLAGQLTTETAVSSSSFSSPLLELVFVIRPDMLPTSLVGQRNENGTFGLDINVSPWLRARVVEGTYGDSVHPDLDCGSRMGPPDMVMAFNAGLYAYESWRSVLKYLREHSNVVAVLSDYNEFSGVQCARLGGSPETLRVNPFRQPRAMPVYSMNLPQFSNGFLYAINPQEL